MRKSSANQSVWSSLKELYINAMQWWLSHFPPSKTHDLQEVSQKCDHSKLQADLKAWWDCMDKLEQWYSNQPGQANNALIVRAIKHIYIWLHNWSQRPHVAPQSVEKIPVGLQCRPVLYGELADVYRALEYLSSNFSSVNLLDFVGDLEQSLRPNKFSAEKVALIRTLLYAHQARNTESLSFKPRLQTERLPMPTQDKSVRILWSIDGWSPTQSLEARIVLDSSQTYPVGLAASEAGVGAVAQAELQQIKVNNGEIEVKVCRRSDSFNRLSLPMWIRGEVTLRLTGSNFPKYGPFEFGVELVEFQQPARTVDVIVNKYAEIIKREKEQRLFLVSLESDYDNKAEFIDKLRTRIKELAPSIDCVSPDEKNFQPRNDIQSLLVLSDKPISEELIKIWNNYGTGTKYNVMFLEICDLRDLDKRENEYKQQLGEQHIKITFSDQELVDLYAPDVMFDPRAWQAVTDALKLFPFPSFRETLFEGLRRNDKIRDFPYVTQEEFNEVWQELEEKGIIDDAWRKLVADITDDDKHAICALLEVCGSSEMDAQTGPKHVSFGAILVKWLEEQQKYLQISEIVTGDMSTEEAAKKLEDILRQFDGNLWESQKSFLYKPVTYLWRLYKENKISFCKKNKNKSVEAGDER